MEIKAKCNAVIYSNAAGWKVTMMTTDAGEELKVTGVIAVEKGKNYTVIGDVFVDPKYGKEFKATASIEEDNEQYDLTNLEGLEAFISKKVKGLGPKTAHKVVLKFGTETFKVISETPEELLVISGITRAKLPKITESFFANTKFRKLFVELAPYGITDSQINRIAKEYGDMAYDTVIGNPYILYEDIDGIGFKTADQIASRVGFGPKSPQRLKAAVLYTLEDEAGTNGHTFLFREDLEKCLMKLMAITEVNDLDTYISLLQSEDKLHIDDDRIYRKNLWDAEQKTACEIRRLAFAECESSFDAEPMIGSIEEDIRKANKYFTCFDELQRQAILNAANQSFSILTGGPGTGKTSTINGIIKALVINNPEVSIVLCAPTGKAAKRMSQQTGLQASTIHRLLAENGMNEAFCGDVFIIDESSMIDVDLMGRFLSMIPAGSKVVIIGDTDQLPSIGPGNVLKDMIASEVIPTVYLDKVYRQAGECGIVMTSQKIKKGDNAIEADASIRAFSCDDDETAYSMILQLYKQSIAAGYGRDEVIVLTPFRKGRKVSSVELNNAISSMYKQTEEPLAVSPAMSIKAGDRVMHIKNDYDLEWTCEEGGKLTEGKGVYNGDAGTVVTTFSKDEDSDRNIEVLLDDGKRVIYSKDRFNELDLAFATTIHKSQGSEYPVVICPVLTSQSFFLNRNLVYTAITRASKRCAIVGQRKAYCIAVSKKSSDKRNTYLAELLGLDTVLRKE